MKCRKGFDYLVQLCYADTTSFASEEIQTTQVTKTGLNGGRERSKEDKRRRKKRGWKIERSKEKKEGKGGIENR